MRNATSLTVLAVFTAFVPSITLAASPIRSAPAVRPFDRAAFNAAEKAGKPIIVWVHAVWCPVCREQAKTIGQITAAPAYRDVQIFRIDYDTQRAVWKSFGATMQSTLIAFHGSRETGRIAHETDNAELTAVIRSALVQDAK